MLTDLVHGNLAVTADLVKEAFLGIYTTLWVEEIRLFIVNTVAVEVYIEYDESTCWSTCRYTSKANCQTHVHLNKYTYIPHLQ